MVSSIVKRIWRHAPCSWRSRLWSIRADRLSSMASSSSPMPKQTSAIASSVQPPTKTQPPEECLAIRGQQRIAPGNRAAQRSAGRYGRSRGPPVRSASGRYSCTRSAGGAKSLLRAAASSIASGRPSSRAQIALIAARSSSPGANSGLEARYRSTNSRTASESQGRERVADVTPAVRSTAAFGPPFSAAG